MKSVPSFKVRITSLFSNAVIAIVLMGSLPVSQAAQRTVNILTDANGNITQAGKYYFQYTDDNRLKAVRQGDNPGKIVENYIVDPLTNKRVKKILNAKSVEGGNNKPGNKGGGGSSKIVYYPFTDVVEVVGGKEAGTTNYYRDDSKRTARKDHNNNIAFIHPDHLGSTHILSDNNGELIERTTQYPYGEVRSGTEEERYSFTEKELDTTGIYDFHARSYDPFIRNFLQPDSVVPFPVDELRNSNNSSTVSILQDISNFNVYSYSRSNPIAYIDLNGNVALPAAIAIAGLAILDVGLLSYDAFLIYQATDSAQSAAQVYLDSYAETVAVNAGIPPQAAVAGAVLHRSKNVGTRLSKHITRFYHGTDRTSAEKLLNGGQLNTQAVLNNKIDGNLGFYLATDYSDAEYFALRRTGSGGVVKFDVSSNAMQQLSEAGVIQQSIPPMGNRSGKFSGEELFINEESFDLFNSLLESGEITVK